MADKARLALAGCDRAARRAIASDGHSPRADSVVLGTTSCSQHSAAGSLAATAQPRDGFDSGSVAGELGEAASLSVPNVRRVVEARAEQQARTAGVRRKIAEPVLVRARLLRPRRREALDVFQSGDGLAAQTLLREGLAQWAAHEHAVQQEVKGPRHMVGILARQEVIDDLTEACAREPDGQLDGRIRDAQSLQLGREAHGELRLGGIGAG